MTPAALLQSEIHLRPARWYHYASPRNVAWMNDSAVTEFLAARGKMTLRKSWRYFQAHKNVDQLLAIYFNGRHVGNCGFFDINTDSAELRIAIGDRSTWGKGVGKTVMRLMIEHAFTAGWKKIILHVNPANTRAVQLYTKIGFKPLGMVPYEGAPDQLRMEYMLTNSSTAPASAADSTTVVLADGCLDPMHEGHIAYLEAAKALGTKLVVNTVTDEEIWQKRPTIGPFLPRASRMAVLRALRAVDDVVIMDTLEALRTVKPQIYAKGKDWENRLPEAETKLCAELGITVVYLDTVHNSSTKLLKNFITQVKEHHGI